MHLRDSLVIKQQDQESKTFSFLHNGGMTIKAQSVSMDNVGGSTAARDDIDGYKSISIICILI